MFNRLPLQILILLLVGLLVGVLNNTVSPNKIPWVQEYVMLDKLGEKVEMPAMVDPETDSVFTFISTRLAYNLYNDENTLFIDARIPEDYKAGHIAGAINVDFEGDEEDYNRQIDSLMILAEPDRPLVTYCSGTDCDASLMLARLLYYDLGYTNINVYFGGWDQWLGDSLPTETDSL